jgi:hypothetical protein
MSSGTFTMTDGTVYTDCLRWESNTNLKGPYSEIYSAIIP